MLIVILAQSVFPEESEAPYQTPTVPVTPLATYSTLPFTMEIDQAFIADVPELSGCMAHGNTYESALSNARQATALWLQTAEEFGDKIPVPKGRRLAFA